MVKTVIKMDGHIADFCPEKIVSAITRAMERTDAGVDLALANKIADYIMNKSFDQMTVEDIHNMVERKLMGSSRKDAAKAYVKYRQRRDIARQSKTRVMFDEIIATKSNDVTRENANMNADTPAGMMMKFASETTKPFVNNYLLEEDVKDAMESNYFHVHDKDYYPTKSLTCLQHPLDKLFEKGFRAGHGESRPPKRIETAAIQACISMETVQNEMHGGQAIPAFDFYLAPYVRNTFIEELQKTENIIKKDLSHLYNTEIYDYIKCDTDKLTGDELYVTNAVNNTVDRVHQAMEAFVHNMNTIHSRGGNQVVFSSINYGTDTSAEGRCVIREILKTTYAGVGNGSTAIFPIQIWKLKRGVSYLPTDRNYDLYCEACKVTAKRFFPNFVNLDATYNVDPLWNENDPKRYEHEVSTMGCRTRVYGNRFGESTSIGRGNLSFTTINFVRIAIEAAQEAQILVKNASNSWDNKLLDKNVSSEEKSQKQQIAIDLFYKKLDEIIALVGKQLNNRYNFQATATAKQFPLLMSGLWVGSENLKADDPIAPVIKHGTLGVGFIGLAETLIALTGHHHGESDTAQKLGVEIVAHLDKKCKELSDQYDHNYSCFATPAEGLSGKFTKIDKKEFGEIPGITDKDYYTNSNHVPVWYKCSAKHKAEIEGVYHPLTPAGHIFYVELDGDATNNIEAIQDIVDLMVKNNIGYGSVNHNKSRCIDCGHESAYEFPVDDNGNKYCPVCESLHVSYLQRITGYLVSTTDKWNAGKKAELKDRVQHT